MPWDVVDALRGANDNLGAAADIAVGALRRRGAAAIATDGAAETAGAAVLLEQEGRIDPQRLLVRVRETIKRERLGLR